jgi:hypothetical protein
LRHTTAILAVLNVLKHTLTAHIVATVAHVYIKVFLYKYTHATKYTHVQPGFYFGCAEKRRGPRSQGPAPERPGIKKEK